MSVPQAVTKSNFKDLSFYELYGITDENLSIDVTTIRKKYRKMSVLFHPDKDPSARDIFEHIKLALDTLTDESKRHEYDDARLDLLRKKKWETDIHQNVHQAALDVTRREAEASTRRQQQQQAELARSHAADTIHSELMSAVRKCPVRAAEEEMLQDWDVDMELLNSKEAQVQILLDSLQQQSKRWRSGEHIQRAQ